ARVYPWIGAGADDQGRVSCSLVKTPRRAGSPNRQWNRHGGRCDAASGLLRLRQIRSVGYQVGTKGRSPRRCAGRLLAMNETIYMCEGCGKVVDPDAREIVRAVALLPETTGSADSFVEGLGVYFHDHCYVGEPFFRLKPETDAAGTR